MKILKDIMKSYLTSLFNTRAAGIYMLLFAAAIGVATFVENDFGTSAAQKVIFKAWWFELLLVLFGITIVVNIFKYRMIQLKQWSLMLFHAAILVILFGAAITRYFGYEGIMHIRENSTANSFLSSNTYLKFSVTDNGKSYTFSEPVLFASLGNNYFNRAYVLNANRIDVKVKNFIPNPIQELVQDANGKPTVQIVISGANGRENHFVSEGQTKQINDIIYNFNQPAIPGAFNILYRNDSLLFQSSKTWTQTVMATQMKDTVFPTGNFSPLALRALYNDGVHNIVFPVFLESGKVQLKSKNRKVQSGSTTALLLDVTVDETTKEAIVYGNSGRKGTPVTLNFEGLNMNVSYGSRVIEVPFSVRLNKFILEKYPGTNSASSYASEVTLLDRRKDLNMDYRIYMNNILDYGGYRFFQSSFDSDEKGTYLSVNHDFWGTWISYIGYFLLTLGLVLTLFSKKSRFYQLTQLIKSLRKQSGTFIFLVLFSSFASLQAQAPEKVVSLEHANTFSKIVVQDFKGRMKPMHTLAREIMRKVARKESMFGLSAEQIMLSMFVDPNNWYEVPLIKLGKHEDTHKVIGVSGEYAAYLDFFTEDGTYKLGDEMRRIYGLQPIDRGVYEKELMKIDERLNIVSMVFSGTFLKIIPNPGDKNNTWLTFRAHQHQTATDEDDPMYMADIFFNTYGSSLNMGIQSGDFSQANELIEELMTFQERKGGAIMPSESKIKAEILLNKLNVFTRLAFFYILLSISLLFFLFLSVFKPSIKLKNVYYILFSLVLLGFALHTLGLGLRWYISGRAPWSNGYESMIYIGWTTTLAGVLFTRKSFGGLAATMVLAATILFVSTLSFLDPEITPLVPVLKSYWLTIHVSLEAGSYGFLMLGAIIGLINLILMMFLRDSNQKRIHRIVLEMSYISELTLIGGLIMVSVGTYLGGIWANESWGRYWGWDAKETWALVTILVYAFILHMRLIPKLNGLYAYNLASIFGLASVLMTYYGVNYYLSGLHSYATGDPVPVPVWVHIFVLAVVFVSGVAYYKKQKYPSIT